MTVEELLNDVRTRAAADRGYLPLQGRLERFSPGTPVRDGHPAITKSTTARMDNGEVVLEDE